MEKLRKLRQARGFSVKKVAEALGCTEDCIFKKERGDRPISLKDAKALEKLFGIDRRFWLYPEEFSDLAE